MKILFITNAARFNYVEPIGLMYLSTLARQHGHETHFVSANLRDAKRIIAQWRPDVAGYTASTAEFENLLRLNRALKADAAFFSVFGGPHATFSPQSLLADPAVDAVCLGEGEGAFVDLLSRMAAGQPVNAIDNVWVKDADGGFVRNAVRPLVEDLDSLPFPDRDAYYRLFNRPRVYGIAHFIAGRGCPYNCAFCFNRSYFEMYRGKGTRVRHRSPENVVEEMAQVLRDYPYEAAMFRDDTFPWEAEWLERFAAAYRKRVGRPFICNLRVEKVNATVCRLLKEAGCHTALMGIECGNEELRGEMLNRMMSNDEIRQACASLRQAGIRITATNMVGVPSETVETAMETLRLNAECGVDLANATFYQPYPGTVLGERACEMGLITDAAAACGAKFFYSGRDYRLPDKARLERLRALLPPAAGLPVLARWTPALAGLPLGAVYRLIEKLWTGYCSMFRLYPIRMTPWRLMRMAWRYLAA